MKFRAAAATAMLVAAASLLLTVPSAAAVMQQQKGVLPKGGSYVLDPDPTIAAASVALWFRAPGAGYDNAAPGIARLAATAAAVSPLASGKSLYELVHSVGGELNIQVYPDIVGVDAVVPSVATRRVVAALTAAYYAPSIEEPALKTAQKDAAVLAVQQRYSADLVVHDLLFKEVFAAGPAHYPPLPNSVADITRIPVADVSAFARRAFRASNSVLMLSGNVDNTSIDAVTDGNGAAAMDNPFDSEAAASASISTAAGSVDGVGLAWVGPPISDTKAATALDFVADYLFRPDSGAVSKALDEDKNDAFVSGQFITLHDPGIMLVTIDGGKEKDAKQRVIDELAKLEEPMDARAFTAAREAFLYHIAYDTQTPAQRTDNLGWYTVEGNASYAPGDDSGEYERIARDLNPQYVAGIVKRYLHDPTVVNLITTAAKESNS